MMNGRKHVQIENADVRVTVMVEGGHIAEIVHKATGVNPMWAPPWPSIEPSSYSPDRHPEYGLNSESKLLAGIRGHNLCLDLFGGPSPEEAEAGMTVHGECSVNEHHFDVRGTELTQSTTAVAAGLRFERSIALDGDTLRIRETVENLNVLDRPVAWTQHVTLGAPFIEPGATEFRIPATRSRSLEADMGYMKPGTDFDWPYAPQKDGGQCDLRVYPRSDSSAAYSAHLLDPSRDDAFFIAWSPRSRLLIGYQWKRTDFPWLGRWEENRSRTAPPWNGKTITCGMEFGVSPMPEPRRNMIDRGSLFGVPGYRWIPARQKATCEYTAFVRSADSIPEEP